MPELPTGTVTFLFTDVEGSTALWEQHRDAMRLALVRHDALVEQIVAEHHGHVVRPRGEGDSRFAVFARATDAVAAAAALQQALAAEPWPTPTPLRVRMALHTGETDLREGDYYGSAVNRCARLRAVAHGEQTLVSLATEQLVRGQLPSAVILHDLGEHRLKDLQHPERVFALIVDGVRTSFPPLKTMDARPNNLPVQRGLLIGREREVADVIAMLRKPEVGLVTLTGPGGIGKTRLALQAAAELLEHFADGVWFIDLAPITDPVLISTTIAWVLGVKEVAGEPVATTLSNFLHDRQILLVLDNFEQVVTAAPLLTDLLQIAPELTLLVTSREILRLSGEHEYPVPPLAVSQPGLSRMDDLADVPAVELFVQRAQAVKPSFRLTASNVATIAAICARLDGLPLALELAAARIKLFTPEALLQRLGHRLRTLSSGPRDRAARQQTLRNTLDWSYSLLDPAEQRLFTCLGVFVGGCMLEAVEAVCNGIGDETLDVVDGCLSLVNKSLLQQVSEAGDVRFTMFDTIREYALEQLIASGQQHIVCHQHTLYYLQQAELFELAAETADPQGAYRSIQEDIDNMRAALQHALESSDPETGLRLASALWPYWMAQGSFGEGRMWMERALNRSSKEPTVPYAMVLARAGDLAWRQSDLTGARILGGASLVAWEALGEITPVRAERVVPYGGSGHAFMVLGNVAEIEGNVAQATRYAEEGLRRNRNAGDTTATIWSLYDLGRMVTAQGEYARAMSLIEEGLALACGLGVPVEIGSGGLLLGRLALAQGNHAEAIARFEESLFWLKRAGGKVYVRWSNIELGRAAALGGDVELAERHYQAALALVEHNRSAWGIALCLHGLARTAYRKQDLQRAARLLGAAESIRGHDGPIQHPVDKGTYEELWASLLNAPTPDLEAAWTEGRAMTFEQAIDYALEDAPDT